jgi:hypothetical protein
MSASFWMYALTVLLCTVGSAKAGNAPPSYPGMAPFTQYLMASPAEEAALARSAAPASISDNAEVITLGTQGYETAAKGSNGFVCLVWRSWAADFADPVFWNPKIRGPTCLNPAAARTILPGYLERTQWVLGGSSKAEMIARTKANIAANRLLLPESGAMCYMMSKQGYLSDTDGHWHPHLMFFQAHTDAAAWGANLKGSPILAGQSDPEPVTTYMVPVSKWSDGTPSAGTH